MEADRSFDDLFLQVAGEMGELDAPGSRHVRAVSLRLAETGHPVPMDSLITSMEMLSAARVGLVTREVGRRTALCVSCRAEISGVDVLRARSVRCERCRTAEPQPEQPATLEEALRVRCPPSGNEVDTRDPGGFLGKVVGGYRVVSVLGQGGWGAVYLAEHEKQGTKVALKVLSRELGRSGEHLEKFMTEGRITAALVHPVIRRTVEASRDGDLHFLALEYVDGRSLQATVEQSGPLKPAWAAGVARRLAEALEFAQRGRVIHRDIKPHNVLISREGDVKLLDFGLARIFLAGTGVSESGPIHGTPEYMSPEQFDGLRMDHRSDIYSLGCTLYFMLTGRPPFDGSDLPSLMRQHKSVAPPSPLRFRDGIPSSLCAVLARMMAKRPEARFQDYAALVSSLRAEESLPETAQLEVPADPASSAEAIESWLDDERVKRCAEIEELFRSEGLLPPPRWHTLIALGYARDSRPRGDDRREEAVELSCAGCGAAVKISGEVPDSGPKCRRCGGTAMRHAWFAIDRRACFLGLRLHAEWAEDPQAIRAVVRLSALSGRHNTVLDFSAALRFPQEAVGALMALREQLTSDRVAPVIVVSPRAMKSVESLGLQEFFLVLTGRDEAEGRIDSGELCPHLRYFLCAVRDQLAGGAESVAQGLEKSAVCCLAREEFQAFYARIQDAIRQRNAPAVRALGAKLLQGLGDEPCLSAVAERVSLLSAQAVRENLVRTVRALLRRGDLEKARAAVRRLQEGFPDAPETLELAGEVESRATQPQAEAGRGNAETE